MSAAFASAVALKFDPPAGWVSKPPASAMRIAEFTLPKTGADAEDAALTVWVLLRRPGWHHPGQSRSLDWSDVAARWPRVQERRQDDAIQDHIGFGRALLDVSGTDIAEVQPGSTERFNKPGFRLRAAVIETPGGPDDVKLTGPAATVTEWDAAFMAFLKSAKE